MHTNRVARLVRVVEPTLENATAPVFGPSFRL